MTSYQRFEIPPLPVSLQHDNNQFLKITKDSNTLEKKQEHSSVLKFIPTTENLVQIHNSHGDKLILEDIDEWIYQRDNNKIHKFALSTKDYKKFVVFENKEIKLSTKEQFWNLVAIPSECIQSPINQSLIQKKKS